MNSLIDKKEFLRQVVRPALDVLGLRGGGADILVLGTALTESGGLKYIRQVGGPALGFFQVEPATHLDLWVNWLRFSRRAQLRGALNLLADSAGSDSGTIPEYAANNRALMLYGRLTFGPDEDFSEALQYGAAICRLVYRRRPEPLPDPGNPLALAMAWKLMYNTVAGKGTVERAGPWFREAIRIGIELDTEEGLG